MMKTLITLHCKDHVCTLYSGYNQKIEENLHKKVDIMR